jgi:hypothetical protein
MYGAKPGPRMGNPDLTALKLTEFVIRTVGGRRFNISDTTNKECINAMVQSDHMIQRQVVTSKPGLAVMISV